MSDPGTKEAYEGSVRGLLDSLQRRHYGQPARVHPNVGQLENLRTATEWTGNIDELQLMNVRRLGVLLGEGPVELQVDVPNKRIHFIFENQKLIHLTTAKVILLTDQLTLGVRAILGEGWTLNTSVRKKSGTKRTRAKGKPSTRRGRGSRKASRR